MTETVMRLIIDCETGEESLVPYTEEELAQRELDSLAAAQAKAIQDAEFAAADAARESAVAKLIAVGLTEEEIAALRV
jgi:DNA-binding NarL/FixJ family response regulator